MDNGGKWRSEVSNNHLRFLILSACQGERNPIQLTALGRCQKVRESNVFVDLRVHFWYCELCLNREILR